MVNHWLNSNKYGIFCSTLIFLLFAEFIFDAVFPKGLTSLITLLIILASGVNLVEHEKGIYRWSHIIAAFIGTSIVLQLLQFEVNLFRLISFLLSFAYFSLIAFLLLKQIVTTINITTQTIIGAFSGYILLGILGYFLFALIEIISPGSFSIGELTWEENKHLFYFSFITLTTIGYGDISPVSPLAQRTAVLLGLTGQFYLTVVIAFLVGKHLQLKT